VDDEEGTLTRTYEPDAPVNAEEYLASQPPALEVIDALRKIRERVVAGGGRVIVLDDDPMGTQTVHDVPVLTAWSYAELRWALEQPNPVVYVLTNSRSLDEPDAAELNEKIGRRLRRAASDSDVPFVVVSRSDSTLRGHYPAEIDTLERELGVDFDGVIVCPCFFEAGRVTLDDVQWVRQGPELVPAALTEFATDSTFGYSSSNLARWIEEKTGGRTPAEGVLRVGIADIREGGPGRITALLQGARDGQPIVVNAAEYADLEVFVLGLLEAEATGKSYLYRTGPSFVRVRGGIPERPPLEARDLYRASTGRGHGLVLVGSHVRQTTRQLRAAKELDGLRTVELSVTRILDPEGRTAEVDRVVREVDEMLSEADVVVYTSREVVHASGDLSGLEVGSAISAALVDVMRRVDRGLELGFVVAKGGITSSDVATKGLGVRRAEVAGQMLPGIVSAWILPEDSDYPGLPYVVFPGNVGDEDALAEVIQKLRAGPDREATEGNSNRPPSRT
jgi:uncharacterized protein YgbK (DUF1537 family)